MIIDDMGIIPLFSWYHEVLYLSHYCDIISSMQLVDS